MTWTELLVFIPVTLILLNILVIVHEFGHFIVARKSGVRTPEFSVGFGPLLAKTVHNGVQYSLRAIPLGGFVKIVGMDIALEGNDENNEDAKIPANERFDSLPLWRKLAVIIAGPFNNLVLAFLTFVLIVVIFGMPVDLKTNSTVIGNIDPKSPAFEAGLSVGDKVLAINNKPIKKWDELVNIVHHSAGKTLIFRIERKNHVYIRTIKPFYDPSLNVGRIGIGPPIVIKHVSLGTAIVQGSKQAVYTFKAIIIALGRLFVGKERLTGLGPIGMVSAVQQAAAGGGFQFFYTFGALNLFLGIFNLLPIPLPLLDGGWVTILLLERLRRKEFTPEQKAMAQMIGMGLMLVLFVIISYSDVSSHIKRSIHLGR